MVKETGTIKTLLKWVKQKGITPGVVHDLRYAQGKDWEFIGKYFSIRKERIIDVAERIHGIDTSEEARVDIKKYISTIREIPLISRKFKPIPVFITRTYTRSGLGEKLWQLHVYAAYRNEKTGDVVAETHRSRASLTKDYDKLYEECVTRPDARPETNWIIITDPEDPDYVPIIISWRRYGGKKGFYEFK